MIFVACKVGRDLVSRTYKEWPQINKENMSNATENGQKMNEYFQNRTCNQPINILKMCKLNSNKNIN